MVGDSNHMVSPGSRLAWRRLSWRWELLSIALGYALYAVVRFLEPQHLQASYHHAAEVVGFERSLGLLYELPLNAFLARHDLLEDAASWFYATLHFLVTPLVLVWLWKRRPALYAPLRSALVMGTAVALVVYAAWPLAPPRFAVGGMVDSVMRHPLLWTTGHGVKSLINEVAAMPSLHVGWAVWCAVAVATASTHRLRHLAWLYPIATTFVVVATANHYVLDAVGGALVVAVPLWLCGLAVVPLHPLVAVPASDPVREPMAA